MRLCKAVLGTSFLSYKKLNHGFNSTNLTMDIFKVPTAKPSDMKFHVCNIAQLFP